MIPYLTKKELSVSGRRLTILEYLASHPLSRYADSLRSLRIRLRLGNLDTARVIQFTSAIPGEGKSTAAVSLALSAANSGIRTVLVDLDFRNPAISNMFSIQQREGVVDILRGNAVTGSVLQTHQRLPLRIIGAGSSFRPRPDMMETRQFRHFIEELTKGFDLVVLDTPPILVVSDPALIAGVADTTVVVVAWRSTPQQTVNHAIAALKAANAPLAGIILNKIDLRKIGRYDHAGYGYDYYADA